MGEFSSANDIETVVEEGFDVIEVHISCPLPHAHSINVSIMGLRSYIEDIEKKQSSYRNIGEIKGDVIWLKYRANYHLAGLENGNKLVKMLLTEKSIPYFPRKFRKLNVGFAKRGAICRMCVTKGSIKSKNPKNRRIKEWRLCLWHHRKCLSKMILLT